MLARGKGVTKRGETYVESPVENSGSPSHHAAVHSLLKSRRNSFEKSARLPNAIDESSRMKSQQQNGDTSSVSVSSNVKSTQSSVVSAKGKISKPKKFWKAIKKGGWRKTKHENRGEGDGNESHVHGPDSPSLQTPPDDNDILPDEDVNASDYDDPDHDAPWIPTMSMLLQTGQLDCIESDSDEDNEDMSDESVENNGSDQVAENKVEGESNQQNDFDNSKFNHSPGTLVNFAPRTLDENNRFESDGFINQGRVEGENDFFDQVAKNYRSAYLPTMQMQSDDSVKSHDTVGDSGRTLGSISKEDTIDTSDTSRNKKKLLESNMEHTENSPKSRRQVTEQSATDVVDDRGKDDHLNDNTRTSESPARAPGGRSRSFLRRRHMNIFRRSSSKSKSQDKSTVHPPRQKSPMDIASHPIAIANSDGSTNSARCEAQSQLRALSHTPSTRTPSTMSNSLYDSSERSANFECVSDLSSRSRQRRHRTKKCLVCRRKILRGESIQYNEFYFCSRWCFSCASCRKSLTEEDRRGGVQVVSNARGSLVQCRGCAKSNMKGRSKGRSSSLERVGQTRIFRLEDSDRSSLAASLSGREFSPYLIDPSGDVSPPESNSFDDSISSFEYYSPLAQLIMMGGSPGTQSTCDETEIMDDSAHGRLSGKEQLFFFNDEESIADDQSMAAAKRLSKKASVKLSLNSDKDDTDKIEKENKHLPILFFTQNEINKRTLSEQNGAELTTKLLYELNSVSYCSLNNSEDDYDKGTPAKTTLALSKFTSDKFDRTISQELEMDLQWLDDDDEDSEASIRSNGGIRPSKSSPAILSIEQFKSITTHKETMTKLLRQTWEYKDEYSDIWYKFSLVVPFKRIYVSSREIDNGDELDLTQCQMEVAVTYDSSSARGSRPNKVIAKTLSTNPVHIPPPSAWGADPSMFASRERRLVPDRDENDIISELLSVASCINSIVKLPKIAYIKIESEDDECEVGLSLLEKNGATVVAEVSKSGMFANVPIKEGCEILAINGQSISGPRSVMRKMKGIVGQVLITVSDNPSPPGARFVVKNLQANGFVSALDPDSQDVTFQTIDGLVSVKSIAENGLFSESPISEGDICLSIDGVPATSDDVATRALARSQSIVAMLVFSLAGFWKSMVEFMIHEKYNRWWRTDSVCTLLLWGDEGSTSVTLMFDEETWLCKAEGNDKCEIELRSMNTIIERVRRLLSKSIAAYWAAPKDQSRDSSRSLSVSPSGKLQNRSDVYRHALVKLDEMRGNGTISAKDYEAGRHALAQVAIRTAK